MSMFIPSGNFNPSRGLYPGSEQKYDQLFASQTAANQELDFSSGTPLSGVNWEVEGPQLEDEAALTLHQAMDQRTGDMSAGAMASYLRDSDASLFDTDYTSLDALARNARYADEIGSM